MSELEDPQLRDMAQQVRKLNIAKGWRNADGSTTTTFGEYIALGHSEFSEALETYRDHGVAEYTTPEGKPDDVGSELADVFIRVLDMCDIFGIDLEFEYARKMDYNWTRPLRHGGRAL